MGLLDGKVAIITGSGNGLGRSHALLFAAEGAKVVVNDVGGSRDGSGAGNAPADQVVAEIKAAGGEAVASYDSVADPEGAANLVKTAVDAFGGVDILVNNAGILRDKTLLKMEDAQWDAVIAVHLKGTYLCTKAAAARMAEQARGGKIVNTSSYAGLMGNFGQANYGAAKAGIAGFTRVTALEFAKHRINVNALAPMAKTRMTDDIAMVPDEMTPEHVAPVALYLASHLSDEVNGRIFGVHGDHLFEYKMKMTEGSKKGGNAVWSAEEIAEKIDEICRDEAPAAAAGGAAPVELGPKEIIARAFERLPEVFVPAGATGWKANVQFEIKDAGDWTIVIEDGTCRVESGKAGTPTCTVKVDAATYADVVMGKTKPEKAFMEGKITASNLGDMMKFGQAFDMKKAKALAEAEKAAAGAGGGAAAAPKELGPKEIIATAFGRLPEVFVPAGAAGWKANVQFEIKGADDYTIIVEDGTCRVENGKSGTPTCTVKVDAATYADVVMGKTKPEKAFMEGKITASNLGDMMKFGQAFDMKKAKTLAEAEKAAAGGGAAAAPAKPAAKAAPSGPGAVIDAAFGMLPEVFVPSGAAGWTANVQFAIKGADDWTVIIADGTCKTEKGLTGTPTCTVKVDAETYAGVVAGKIRAEKAFMEGKITASNLGDMMRFGQAFDMKKAREIAESGGGAAAAGGGDAAASGDAAAGGLNRDYLGRRFSGPPQWVDPEGARNYALASNDENPRYLESDVVAPPLYAVRLLKEALFKVMTEEELGADLLRLVHGEQDMRFHAPLRPGELATLRAFVHSIEDKSSGQILRIGQKIYVGGELRVEALSAMFIRAKTKGAKKKDGDKKDAAPADRGEATFSHEMSVTEDQSYRYADASGDNNPIHVDENVAKMAGFPSVILQGLCTMAFTSQAIIRNACDGDPTRLKRLAVRFAKPVLPKNVLTTSAWTGETKDGLTTVDFEMKNQDDVPVIVNGVAEVSA